MAKLFVALGLSDDTTAALVALQPPLGQGIRLVNAAQMHVTLHYLGEADLERTVATLATVAAPAFSLTIEGVGQFPSAGGTVTLWAGVRASVELLQLHQAIATALDREGFQAEKRPYRPHVTLARCEPDFPAQLVEGFSAQHQTFSLRAETIREFRLYSSHFVENVPVYKCERSFALRSGKR